MAEMTVALPDNVHTRAVYQRRTVTCLATLTESDCTVVLQQKCDNATLIIFISTTTTTTTTTHSKPVAASRPLQRQDATNSIIIALMYRHVE